MLGARFALLRRESLGDLGFADGDRAHPSRSGDFLRLQGAIIKTRCSDGALEHAIGAGGRAVADTEGKVRIVLGVILESGLVRLAVHLAVAITGDGAVGLIHDRELHGLLVGFGFLRAGEGFGAREPVAAGHPALGFAFAEDNAVKHHAVFILQRDCAAAALVEILQFDPHLQCLLGHRHG